MVSSFEKQRLKKVFFQDILNVALFIVTDKLHLVLALFFRKVRKLIL